MERDTIPISETLEEYNQTKQDIENKAYSVTNICKYCRKRHKRTYCSIDETEVNEIEFYQTKNFTNSRKSCTRNKSEKVLHQIFRIFKLFKSERKGYGTIPLLRINSFNRSKCNTQSLPRWISFIIFFILLTSSFSTADYYSDYVSVMMKSYNKSACDGEYLRIECPEATSIHIESAMYGRKVPSNELCPTKDNLETGSGTEIEEDTNCEAKTGSECQDKRVCQIVVHRRVFGKDPCPGTSKYLTVQYKCAPKDFRQQTSCAEQNVKLRCRLGTIISVFKIQLSNKSSCSIKNKNCTMTKQDIMKDLTTKCHSKEKCSYSLPTASCFNHAQIVHTCVPKQFLTSELPSSVELLSTTTSLPTTQSTNYYTTELSTVKPTVTSLSEEKGDLTTFLTSTSLLYEEDTTSANSLNITTENRTNLADQDDVTSAVGNVSAVEILNSVDDGVDDIIIRNDFPMLPNEDMNSTDCISCYIDDSPSSGSIYDTWIKLYNYFRENSDSLIIAVLLGVVVALLLTICVLVFPCKKAPSTEKKKNEQGTELTVADNRQNSTEVYPVAEAPAEEDEHENMSLLGSLLQRSTSSANNTVQRQHVSPNTSHVISESKVKKSKGDRNYCGPKSIFAKICCNCCCNNAPWQRTRILKRHRGDVYRVTHRNSSSSEDDITERFQSRDSFPVFNRTEDNVDNRSPIPVLEDHVNRTEYPIMMSDPVASQTHQQNSNFRPISRNANRQYSLTPEPDMTRRTNHSFRPAVRHESQKSDPALNLYSVQQLQNSTQPQTAPTSPIINHHGNFPLLNGTRDPIQSRARMVSTPKSPKIGTNEAPNFQMHNSAYGAAAQTPIAPKYTPPPSHVYNTQQYPSFTNAYEQYDNTQQPVVRRKQFQRSRDYSTHSQYQHPQQYGTHNGQYAGYYTQNTFGDHFVQAVPRRTVAANAVTVDLAANARTVDLSHNNSLSRNSWLEIRRNSIYDNSLPRNSEMYEYYQKELLAMQQHHQPQNDLPGTRNLNQYY